MKLLSILVAITMFGLWLTTAPAIGIPASVGSTIKQHISNNALQKNYFNENLKSRDLSVLIYSIAT